MMWRIYFSLVLLSCEIVRHTDTQTDRDIKHQCLKCILLTLKELSAVIAMKVIVKTQG